MAHGRALFFHAEQIQTFCADEGVSGKRPDLLGRERPQSAELVLRPAGDIDDEVDPFHDAGANDPGDNGVGPTRRDQLLEDTHIARAEVIVEIGAGMVPLLRKLEHRVAEQSVLAIEQLCVEIFEDCQQQPPSVRTSHSRSVGTDLSLRADPRVLCRLIAGGVA